VLAPDSSQNLDAVYASTNPLAYPISAYSYILVQCAPSADRPTCASPYTNPGIAGTLAQFMRYVACGGQVKMAEIGYSPLPPQLSQFLADAVGRMTGQPAETLTAQNCDNPQFQGGSLGVGAAPPPDPTRTVSSEGNGRGGSGGGTATSANTGAGGGAAGPTVTGSGTATTTTTVAGTAAAVGSTGSGTQSVGGGSSQSLAPAPAAYTGPPPASSRPWPLLALFLVLLVPAVLLSFGRRRPGSPPPDGIDGPP
jgi:phosphate transport system substrate-binding protein